MAEHLRTAPFSWGAWPPTQQRVNEVVKRIADALAHQLEAEGWKGVTILVTEPENASALDHSFFGVETEIVVGLIRAIGKHQRLHGVLEPGYRHWPHPPHTGYDWRA